MGRESAGAYCRCRDFTAGMNLPGLRPSKWLRWQSCPGLAPALISGRSDWSQTYSVAKNDFELLRACVDRFPCVLVRMYTCMCIQVPMCWFVCIHACVYRFPCVLVHMYEHQRPEVDACYSLYIQRRVCLYWSGWSACPGGSLTKVLELQVTYLALHGFWELKLRSLCSAANSLAPSHFTSPNLELVSLHLLSGVLGMDHHTFVTQHWGTDRPHAH